MTDANNPLLAPQRETVGSETKAKYAYQYHWALYRAIQEHSKENEYAVFVELHEDVVLCNSLDVTKAKFEFNQVKTTAAKYTKTALIRQKNGQSPLGKLINSVSGKPFAADVTELNFVALSGFGIIQKKPELKLKKITLPDIDDTELSHLELAIKKELNVTPLPAHLQFIIPDLSHRNFQNDVIAEISKLISSLYPSSTYEPMTIYRVLIDEINKKGEVTYDFAKWDELLKNKALTCTTITNVINAFTNIKNQAKIEASFTKTMSELEMSFLDSMALKKSFDRYQQSKLGSKTLAQLDVSNAIQTAINNLMAGGNTEMKSFLTSIKNALAEKIKRNFATDNDLLAAIICELIMEH